MESALGRSLGIFASRVSRRNWHFALALGPWGGGQGPEMRAEWLRCGWVNLEQQLGAQKMGRTHLTQ